MVEFIGNHLGVMVGLVVGRVVRFFTLRPLTCRHRCEMPVRWSHLSAADRHLVRLSSTTSFRICLYRWLSVSSAGSSPRFRSRSSASDLADAGRVGWKC